MRQLALLFLLGSSVAAWAHDLSGRWSLKIEDKGHEVGATLIIEFTSERARSCISGDWLRLNVVTANEEKVGFFPVADPLSYSIKDNQLTIGRNEVCDAYLWLQGSLDDAAIRGDYFSLGFAVNPRGFFVLSKVE